MCVVAIRGIACFGKGFVVVFVPSFVYWVLRFGLMTIFVHTLMRRIGVAAAISSECGARTLKRTRGRRSERHGDSDACWVLLGYHRLPSLYRLLYRPTHAPEEIGTLSECHVVHDFTS